MRFDLFLGLILFIGFPAISTQAQPDTCLYFLDLRAPDGNTWNGAVVDAGPTNNTRAYTFNPNQRYFSIKAGPLQELEFFIDPVNELGRSTYLWADHFRPGFETSFRTIEGFRVSRQLYLVENAECPECQPVFSPLVTTGRTRDLWAELQWHELPSRDNFLLEWGPAGFSPGTGNTETVSDTTFRVNGLTPLTDYEYYLSVRCTNGQTSPRRGPFPFSTLRSRDVGVTNVTIPATDCNEGPGKVPLQVEITNFGAAPQSFIQLGYQVNGVVADVQLPFDGLYTGVLGSGSSDEFQFDLQFDLVDSVSTYEIVVFADAEDGDTYPENDTFTFQLTLLPVIDNFPFFESFESGDGGIAEDSESLNSSWIHGQPAGPTLLKTTSGQLAWTANRNGETGTELSYLRLPCLDLDGFVGEPVLAFTLGLALDREETESDRVWVEQSADGGETWSVLNTIGQGVNWYTGSDFIPDGEVWSRPTDSGLDGFPVARVSHPLPRTMNEPLRLRVAFLSGGSNSEAEVVVDDIHVFARRPVDMLGIALDIGTGPVCDSVEQVLQFQVANVGVNEVTSFRYGYSINDSIVVISDPMPVNIPVYGLFDVEEFFKLPLNAGEVKIKAWSSLMTDGNPQNDTVEFVLFIPDNTIPFREDFESLAIGEELPFGWATSGSPAAVVQQDGGSGNHALVQPPNEFNPLDIFTTTVGPVENTDTFTFDYRIVDAGGASNFLPSDKLYLSVSTDCFASEEIILDSITQANHIPGEAFATRGYRLSMINSQTVQFRISGFFQNTTNNTVIEFDNFNISRCRGTFETVVTTTGASDSLANDGSISLEPLTGFEPYRYLWDTGDTTATLGGLAVGTYSATITDRFGCTEMITETLDVISSAEDLPDLDRLIRAAPNPSTGLIRLSGDFPAVVELEWQLFNLNGREVARSSGPRKLQVWTEDIDLSALPNGVYFLRVQAGQAVRTLKVTRAGN